MKNRGLNELREMYLQFFESKGHIRMKSFSLIPKNDSGLLLINSGMAPLKPYFTGEETPPGKRATTCQKCIRTPDIENVGKTSRHGTFFEMLGNFSFGDYFKKEAIVWAWEFITEVLEMPKDKLWPSVYLEDDEAYEIWKESTDVDPEKIVRLGKKDNFWEIGLGPCGPSSEIYYDRGEENGCGLETCKPGCECDRYVEFWNLVFTQYDKDESGNYNKLKNPNIDTGMGLERLACIVQNVNNIFEVDTIKAILDAVCKIADVDYNKNDKASISVRVITDHIRSTVMLISDGVYPSNEKRGYVLRRLIRRAIRHGKLIGIKEPFLAKLADVVIDASKGSYVELEEKRDLIKKVISIEQEGFEKTLEQGMVFLNECIEKEKNNKSMMISGKDAFKLHDELGFPIDLTREIALESSMEVDVDGFNKEMEVQKTKSRESRQNNVGWNKNVDLKAIKDTVFLGYNLYKTETKIIGIIKDGEFVEVCNEGDFCEIVLDRTVFYATSGGQITDTGFIKTANGIFCVEDCKKIEGKYIHSGVIKEGVIEKNATGNAEIDIDRRMSIQRNHTATHLLQKALKYILGNHVSQAGSLVEPERLRFDFSHFESIDNNEISKIEVEVNKIILENLNVVIKEMSIEESKKLGATALFDEKYGDKVRVVSVGNYSVELCGGTHLTNTSQIGFFKILSESGIASGIRRIEAITGKYALDYFNKKEKILNDISMLLKTKESEVEKKLKLLIEENKKCEKEIEKLKDRLIATSLDEMLSKVVKVDNVNVLAAKVEPMNMNELRNVGDNLKNKLNSGILVLISPFNDKVNIIVTITKDLVSSGYNAGKIIKEVARVTGGNGGGRPDMAQAGGNDISKIDEAIKTAIDTITKSIKGC